MITKNIPQIRFKGVEGEWEEKKLDEIGKVFDGTHFTPKYTEYGIPFYSVESIVSGLPPKYISIEDHNKNTQTNKPKKGDILITRIGSLCNVKQMEYDGEYSIYVSLADIQVKTLYNSTFILYYLQTQKYKDDFLMRSLTTAVPQKINMNELKSTIVKYSPNISEQTRIASLFTSLDKQISTSEAKLDKLRTIKKTLLKKMFAASGENIPQIRFKGFDGEWEEKMFTEVFDIYSNYAFSRSQLNDTNGKIKNIHYGDILIKYGSILNVRREDIPFLSPDINVQTTTQNFVKDGDIIIADAAEDSAVGKCVEIINSEKFSILSGLHTIPCRPKIQFANGFLGHYMNASAYHSTLFQIMQGTKVSSISKKAISKTKLHYTPNVSEQTRIASLFTALDKQISCQEQKIEKLKAVKKTLLKKMFV